MNIKKCIIPPVKWLNFQKLPQTKNRKLYFSPTFQKVELCNSTFFQQTNFDGALDLNKNALLLAAQGGVSVVYKLVIIQVCLKKASICTVSGQNDYHAYAF